jgi:hypothetical protein
MQGSKGGKKSALTEAGFNSGQHPLLQVFRKGAENLKRYNGVADGQGIMKDATYASKIYISTTALTRPGKIC